jgi:hypothetical protein
MTKSSLTTGISSLSMIEAQLVAPRNPVGCVLFAVKRSFDVDVISTRHGLRIKDNCVGVKGCKYSYYISAVYLASDVGKPAYEIFVEDMDAIVGSCKVTDRILVLGDSNLLKVEWRVQKDGPTFLPITTDLDTDVIEGMLCCDLGKKNSFLDLIFSNASTDITVRICESPLFELDRDHRAYELLVDVRICIFEATMRSDSHSGLLTVKQ